MLSGMNIQNQVQQPVDGTDVGRVAVHFGHCKSVIDPRQRNRAALSR